LGQPLRDILAQRELAAPMCDGKNRNGQDPSSEGLAEGVGRAVAQGLPQIILANHWSIALQQILLQQASQWVHDRVTLSHGTSVVIALAFAQMASWSKSLLYFHTKMSAKPLKRIKPYHEARLENMLCFAQSDRPRSLQSDRTGSPGRDGRCGRDRALPALIIVGQKEDAASASQSYRCIYGNIVRGSHRQVIGSACN
jgi:hypothetical protein